MFIYLYAALPREGVIGETVGSPILYMSTCFFSKFIKLCIRNNSDVSKSMSYLNIFRQYTIVSRSKRPV